MIHDPSKVTSFGCGCSKGRSLATPGETSQSKRVTIYQVLANGNIESEHESLPAARQQAVAVSGRVKVTSKVITI